MVLNLRKNSGATPESDSWWDIRSGGQLVVRGVVLGQVSWFSGNLQEITASATVQQMLHSVQHFRDAIRGIEDSKVEMSVRDLALFVGVCSGERHPRAQRDAWLKTLRRIESTESILEELLGQNKKRLLSAWQTNQWNFHKWITNFLASENMALVRYSRRSGVGIAPSRVSEGDIVALISGVSMPMILRQDQTDFRVVGPAFLPGMMDGEVWKNFDTGPGSGKLIEMTLK